MPSPVSIALRLDGVPAAYTALRSLRTVMAEIEKHGAITIKVDIKGSAAVQADHAARASAAKAELKVLEELARARALAGQGGPGRAAGGGGIPTGGARDVGIRRQGGDELDRFIGKFTAAGLAVDMIKGGFELATNALKQFAGFLLSDVIKPQMELETRATQIANNSGGKLTATDVESKARAVGLRNNMDPMKVIESAGVFQDLTGEPTMGFDLMNTIGTLSKSRGFNPKELTSMAGAIYQPGMKMEDLQRILLMQTAQGDMGSVTLGQMAKLGGRVVAPAASLAGDYETRIATMGALLQSGRKGFGTAETTASGLENFIKESMTAAKGMPGAIVKDASGVEKIADPAKLIADLYRKNAGNLPALKAMGYSDPSARLIGAYKASYGEDFQVAKSKGMTDTEAKEEAAKGVEEFIKSFATANTTMQAEEEKRNAVLQTSGEKFEMAMTQIKEKLLVVMPAVASFVELFSNNADKIGEAGALLARALIWLAETGVKVANGWSRTMAFLADEGDVIKTAVDRGGDTHFGQTHDKGYWRKGESGNFEYVKGAQPGEDAKGNWSRVGKEGALVFMPESAEEAKKKAEISLAGPRVEPGEEFVPGPRADTQEAGQADAGTEALSSAHEELATKAGDAAASMDKLATAIDTATTKLGALNRTKPFTATGT